MKKTLKPLSIPEILFESSENIGTPLKRLEMPLNSSYILLQSVKCSFELLLNFSEAPEGTLRPPEMH